MDTQERTLTLNDTQLNKLNLVDELKSLCNESHSIIDEDDEHFLVLSFSDFNFKKACDIYYKILKPGFNSPKKVSEPINLYPRIDPDLALAKNFYDASGQLIDKNSLEDNPVKPTLFEKISQYIK